MKSTSEAVPSGLEAEARPLSPHSRGRASRSSLEKLTPKEFSALLILQGAHCARCPNTGPYEADHSTPLSFERGKKPDQLLCRECHKAKTFGLRGDVSCIAKAKRIRDKRTQYDKRKANGSHMKSRGFDRTKSKKMDGTVVDRG